MYSKKIFVAVFPLLFVLAAVAALYPEEPRGIFHLYFSKKSVLTKSFIEMAGFVSEGKLKYLNFHLFHIFTNSISY